MVPQSSFEKATTVLRLCKFTRDTVNCILEIKFDWRAVVYCNKHLDNGCQSTRQHCALEILLNPHPFRKSKQVNPLLILWKQFFAFKMFSYGCIVTRILKKVFKQQLLLYIGERSLNVFSRSNMSYAVCEALRW